MAEREAETEVDPTEFLRALLKISPEDAAKAREEATERAGGAGAASVAGGPTAPSASEARPPNDRER